VTQTPSRSELLANAAKMLVSPVPTSCRHHKILTLHHSNFLIRLSPHTNSALRNGGGHDFCQPPSTVLSCDTYSTGPLPPNRTMMPKTQPPHSPNSPSWPTVPALPTNSTDHNPDHHHPETPNPCFKQLYRSNHSYHTVKRNQETSSLTVLEYSSTGAPLLHKRELASFILPNNKP